MVINYPFSAIVGQERLKQALLLCAVNPGIGGVLIKGEKGTAKSTAARGLSAVMPFIERITGSVFNTSVLEFQAGNAGEMDFGTEEIAVPFVDLPLGASEDRVLGSLDLEAIVSEKKRKLLPGLLAAAHRGILYIDEVNLLPDHLVDILLDVAASGINTLQREGLSISHPSKFVLIGTMNPEEGNLRPQFLDRFGLMVEVGAQQNVIDRTEVVRRRMAFEADPEGFNLKWRSAQDALTVKIYQAQKNLPLVEMPEGLLTLISQLCIEWSVASLRADIVMYKTAITIAALAGRMAVNAEDIKQAAQLVLIHRKGKRNLNPGIHPGADTSDRPDDSDRAEAPDHRDASDRRKDTSDRANTSGRSTDASGQAGTSRRQSEATDGSSDTPDGAEISAYNTATPNHTTAPLNPGIYPGADTPNVTPVRGIYPEAESPNVTPAHGIYPEAATPKDLQNQGIYPGADTQLPNLKSAFPTIAPASANGRRSKAANTTKGFQIRTEKNISTKDLAITETLTHAIFRNPDDIQIKKEDLHGKVRSGKTGHLILFVVDASGSMAAGKRMEAVKESVLSLLKDAYQKRDMVGVISFRGVEAEVLLEPTASIDLAESAMGSLPTGGRTPLAHALQLAQQVLKKYPNHEHIQPLLIILSDGKANVPLAGGGDAWQQTLQIASEIAGSGVQSMVLDTENGYVRLGRAAELAMVLKAECLSLDKLSSEGIVDTISMRTG